jgi:hypothetical protein
MQKRSLPKITWKDLRMLAVDGCTISFFLKGEEDLMEHTFASVVEMRAQVEKWFKRGTRKKAKLSQKRSVRRSAIPK